MDRMKLKDWILLPLYIIPGIMLVIAFALYRIVTKVIGGLHEPRTDKFEMES